MRRTTTTRALALAITLAATSCGSGGSHGDGSHSSEASDGEHGAAGSDGHENSEVVEGARPVEVIGTSFAFEPSTITAEADEDLEIVLTADDVAHDLTIDGVEGHVYAPAGATASGGVTTPEPGTYVVYCSISGHREAGMEGTLVVT